MQACKDAQAVEASDGIAANVQVQQRSWQRLRGEHDTHGVASTNWMLIACRHWRMRGGRNALKVGSRPTLDNAALGHLFEQIKGNSWTCSCTCSAAWGSAVGWLSASERESSELYWEVSAPSLVMALPCRSRLTTAAYAQQTAGVRPVMGDVKAGRWAKLKAKPCNVDKKIKENPSSEMCTAVVEAVKRSARRRGLKHCWPGCNLEASTACAHAYEAFFTHVSDVDMSLIPVKNQVRHSAVAEASRPRHVAVKAGADAATSVHVALADVEVIFALLRPDTAHAPCSLASRVLLVTSTLNTHLHQNPELVCWPVARAGVVQHCRLRAAGST